MLLWDYYLCRMRDSNPHVFRQRILSAPRLPIPPIRLAIQLLMLPIKPEHQIYNSVALGPQNLRS